MHNALHIKHCTPPCSQRWCVALALFPGLPCFQFRLYWEWYTEAEEQEKKQNKKQNIGAFITWTNPELTLPPTPKHLPRVHLTSFMWWMLSGLPHFSLLFHFHVLLSMETEERKQGSPGNEANDRVCVCTYYYLTLTVIILSCSVMQCSMDTLKFVCSWHGRISGARLSVKVQYCHWPYACYM